MFVAYRILTHIIPHKKEYFTNEKTEYNGYWTQSKERAYRFNTSKEYQSMKYSNDALYFNTYEIKFEEI